MVLISCKIPTTWVATLDASAADADKVPTSFVNSRTFLAVYNCSSRLLVAVSEARESRLLDDKVQFSEDKKIKAVNVT